MNLYKNILLILSICLLNLPLIAGNSIRMIPDETNACLKFEISRTNPEKFKIKLLSQKGKVLKRFSEQIDDMPKMISISWVDYPPGNYYVIMKSKKESIKLLFIKK